ncbi:MAG: hypothetical protein ACAH59_01735 [Pseudobdellovibrionaceae bacterium]
MSLKNYFTSLKQKLENSDVIQNDGKDENGFYLPTRTVLLRHLQLLTDLHDKPLAQDRVRDSWNFVIQHIPPEWLVLTESQKTELQKILKPKTQSSDSETDSDSDS